jgi:hypothetical protein
MTITTTFVTVLRRFKYLAEEVMYSNHYRVYFNRPNNVENLRQRIRAEIEQISPVNPDIIERSVQSVGECQIVGGRQFQHLR